MPSAVRDGDATTGICNKGLPCCPHGRTGTVSVTSGNVYVNGKGGTVYMTRDRRIVRMAEHLKALREVLRFFATVALWSASVMQQSVNRVGSRVAIQRGAKMYL